MTLFVMEGENKELNQLLQLNYEQRSMLAQILHGDENQMLEAELINLKL